MAQVVAGVTTRLRSLQEPIEPASQAAYTAVLTFAGAGTLTIDLTQRDNDEGWRFDVQAAHIDNLQNANVVTCSVNMQGANWNDAVAVSGTRVIYPPTISPFRMDVQSAGAGTVIVTLYNVPQFPTKYP
jgi:hypothetical protein